jgi:cobalamin synthase
MMALAAAIAPAFARRFGGITGDLLGAGIILSETMVLLLTAFAGGWL